MQLTRTPVRAAPLQGQRRPVPHTAWPGALCCSPVQCRASKLESHKPLVARARVHAERSGRLVCAAAAEDTPAAPPSPAPVGSAALLAIPQDIKVELKPEDGTTNIEYDEPNKVVRIPLSAMGSEGQRRTKLVLFTCNPCGGRTARLVNPVAWEKGAVFGQCGKCGVWHVLSAPNKNIFEEVRYNSDAEI